MNLAYSQLTDKVYAVNKKKEKVDVTQEFIQMMLLWVHQGEPEMLPGGSTSRKLSVNGKVHWAITIERNHE